MRKRDEKGNDDKEEIKRRKQCKKNLELGAFNLRDERKK